MMKSFPLLILSLHLLESCYAKCTPSACGILRNISFPFRLKNDPTNCGDPMFELACENDVATINLDSHKYYVKEINYSNDGNINNSTIRIVDASINSDDVCSFPSHSAYAYNFIYHRANPNTYTYPYRIPRNSSYPYDYKPVPINFITCPNPLKNSSSLFTLTQIDCASNSHEGYAYAKLGHMKASELIDMCLLEVIVMTSWEFRDLKNASLSEIHHALLYGFELIVCPACGDRPYKFWDILRDCFYSIILPTFVIIVGLLLAMICPPIMSIIGFFSALLLLYYYVPPIILISDVGGINAFSISALISTIIICAPRIIIFPLAMWFLIYKFRKKRFSIFEAIESFLQSDNRLTTIRYSYSDIRKMTRGFQNKLGEGGYGSVYKGKLRSGHHVAVKLLEKSRGTGQDFINEIATIGRIHHVNVVKLVGYCAQGSKQALVYDFMPNSSLEKYLFNREKMNFLSWDTKFEIAVGVARGIEYLHQGCDIQILHFDIKPHNILLDENFVPKISDFGLAKFYSTDKKTVTMTTARGTIGYVAPELISRSIGAISYKADVYSFGMLLIEMVGLKKDMIGNHNDSSKYFPNWIYHCFERGMDIEIGIMEGNDDTSENDDTRKLARKMTIVALWCIQMCPDDRPSMSKVLQMLESDVDRLQIPDSPSPSSQNVEIVDESDISCFSDFVSLQISN